MKERTYIAHFRQDRLRVRFFLFFPVDPLVEAAIAPLQFDKIRGVVDS